MRAADRVAVRSVSDVSFPAERSVVQMQPVRRKR